MKKISVYPTPFTKFQAMKKFTVEKDVATYIKKEFEKKYSSSWHCIVGRNFGCYVTHEPHHFIYIFLCQKAILLYKSGSQEGVTMIEKKFN